MNDSFLPNNLAFLRDNKKLTQTEIEVQTGIARRNWSNWENDVSQPSIANLITIGNLFSVPIDWLIKLNLQENVQLIENLPSKLEDIKCTSKSTSNSTSNLMEEPEIAILQGKPADTNTLILQQLKTLTEEVKKIGENLLPKGV